MNDLKFPVGMQSFPEIRERGFVYVDKSQYIPPLFNMGKYFFLGRPRRFGKSLFISMLKTYFEGKKEYFKGLAIADFEKDWTSRPVLHFDFTGNNYSSEGSLTDAINQMLIQWEKRYETTSDGNSLEIRLQNIILAAYEKTGEKVVLLIDEYDKPLIDTIETPDLQDAFRNQLRGLYGNLKKMDSYIHFAFLTGISRFGKLNIFSDLNNLKDLSLMTEFSGICGITSEELTQYFNSSIEEFGASNNLTKEEAYKLLKDNYDGYHFSPKGSPDIYNPFSLMNALQDKGIGEYWFTTGTPLFLIRRLLSRGIELQNFNETWVLKRQIENVPFDLNGDPIPILYQTGYLTIKDYNPENGFIMLGFPNREVEHGFLEQLFQVYVSNATSGSEFNITDFIMDIEKGNVEDFMQRIQSFFAGINYDGFNLLKLEQHYQNVIYLLFKLMGYYCHTEFKTATGRIDLLVETKNFLYLFEFKLNKSAEAALKQINAKDYSLPFKLNKRKLFKIGVNFNSKLKNIDR